MANLRIRYEEHKYRDNWMISIKTFVSKINGARYKVLLDLEEKKYFVRNENTKQFVKRSKSYGNINVLKRNARDCLKSLGVEMGREVRDRSFGVCPKGMTQGKFEKENNL